MYQQVASSAPPRAPHHAQHADDKAHGHEVQVPPNKTQSQPGQPPSFLSHAMAMHHQHQSGLQDHKQAGRTLLLLMGCASIWLVCSYIDATYTPRDDRYQPSKSLIISYQWCMVGYASNLILTLLKVIFETNRPKLKLHMVSCYINILAATSYAMLWTGFSPIVPDVQSCLYIPQRWLLYCFTAPAIIYILCQISDYTTTMRVWVIMLNVFMLAAGGLGTVPWISWPHKVFWYVMSCVPFPSILVHMWRMVSSAVDETGDPTSKRAIKFIRVFSITTWNLFPFVYFAAIDGALSLEISEPLWAALDWLTKMVYSSSLMEANFFTIAQRREFAVRAVEEANRLATIQQLSNAIERKDDFLSAMSHELRTPLNGIIGLSESMMAGACGALPDKALKTILTVKLSGKRLLQLINDILDAAKMKQGTLVIKHEKVDLRRLVTDVLDLSLPLVRKGVKLVNNVGNVPMILGDNGRIVQILYNLVGNAAKFTRQGVISITAGVSEDHRRIYVTVSDTGVGIPKEKVSKIFGAFEQADMSTTRRYGGTGLGLHLVKELIKAHNGEITVQSEVGVGSSFTVWLPISQDGAVMPVEEPENKDAAYTLDLNSRLRRISEDSLEDLALRRRGSAISPAASGSNNEATPRALDSGGRGGVAAAGGMLRNSALSGDADDHLRSVGSSENMLTVSKAGFKAMKPFFRERHGGCMVLSVDDDPINQMVVENLLAPEGYKVEQAMSGSEALEFLARTPALPDVILLDIMMPDMSGYEVCQEIRRRFSKVSIPIIMVSAKGHPEHVMKGLEAGSVDYVKKPFHRQELLSRIRAQVRNREVFEAEMESRKVTEMLKRILPMSVVQRLQQGQSMIADAHDEVTVLFADTASWLSTTHMNSHSTQEIVGIMNEMYSVFEKLLLKYQVFRVEHTGESYLAVSGHDGSQDHLRRMLSLAADMLGAALQLRLPGGEPMRVRIGLHTGPAYAGVVGIDNPRYCVFGDTVSVASALERMGFPNVIHCSEAVYTKLRTREAACFMPARTDAPVGTSVINTYIYKCGCWEEALKGLEDEAKEAEESAEAKRAADAHEQQAAASAAATAHGKALSELEAMAGQVAQLEGERSAAQAAARSAGEEAGVLRARLAAESVERQRMAGMLVAYERMLAEARQTVAAAAAQAAPVVPLPPGAVLGGSPSGTASPYANSSLPPPRAAAGAHAHPIDDGPLLHHHHHHARAGPGLGTGGGLPVDLRALALGGGSGAGVAGARLSATALSPTSSAAGSDIFSLAGGGLAGCSSVAGTVAQQFFAASYTIDLFLQDIGLEQYSQVLREQEVTPLVLATMKEKDLAALGVDTLGARKRMLAAAKQYQSRVKSTARMMVMYKDGQASTAAAAAGLASSSSARHSAAGSTTGGSSRAGLAVSLKQLAAAGGSSGGDGGSSIGPAPPSMALPRLALLPDAVEPYAAAAAAQQQQAVVPPAGDDL